MNKSVLKNRFGVISRSLACCSLLSVSSAVSAIEFKTLAYAGLDNNPHNLSSLLDSSDEVFAVAGFYSESNVKELFYWDVATTKFYYPDDQRADVFDVTADVKFKSDFSIYDVPFEYYIGANYESFDKTFVSKQTGAVATISGVSLANRYDRDTDGYYLGLAYPHDENLKYFIEYRTKNDVFEEISLAGLDNLNNSETTVTLGLNLYTPNDGYFYLDLDYNIRTYDERQDRAEEDGALIADTFLEFNRYGADAGYVFQPDDRTRWEFAFHYINRSTNGTRYYDAQRAKISVKADHRLADYHFLDAELSYQTFYYDEDFDQPYELYDEDETQSRGFKLKLEYSWILATLFDTNMGFYANIQAGAFDSPQGEFVYSNAKIAAGFRWSLD